MRENACTERDAVTACDDSQRRKHDACTALHTSAPCMGAQLPCLSVASCSSPPACAPVGSLHLDELRGRCAARSTLQRMDDCSRCRAHRQSSD